MLCLPSYAELKLVPTSGLAPESRVSGNPNSIYLSYAGKLERVCCFWHRTPRLGWTSNQTHILKLATGSNSRLDVAQHSPRSTRAARQIGWIDVDEKQALRRTLARDLPVIEVGGSAG